MDITPTFTDSVVKFDHQLDLDAYKKSVDMLEAGKYAESLQLFMQYVNATAAKKYKVDMLHWRIPHGSLIVDVQVTQQDYLLVTAPFLKLPADPPGKRIALMRQVCDLNFSALTLSQIVLRGEELTFEFATPMSLVDPFKLYAVLQEICLSGDSFDDEFIGKFGATPLREKEVKPLAQKTVDKAWELYHSYLDESMQYDEYFTQKRWKGFSYDILGIALMKIDHVIAPQGYLRTELEKSVQHLFANKHPDDIVIDLREDFKKFKSFPREKFDSDLYEPNFFIHAKKDANLPTCQKNLQKRYEWAVQDRSGGSNVGVALNYLFATYRLLYNYYVPDKMKKELLGVVKSTSRKPWKDAAEVMYVSFQKIMSPNYQ
ncbi:MAG: hypothetical protein ABIJ56_23145 [Pseudomonadota bacterium]